jgi:16S rRNA (guanine966-N2)-methyltransferase
VRIIGGKHRGRTLSAPPQHGVRPTADRTREALFNILAHAAWAPDDLLNGSVVLDAFCGTGALGLEALSRGAARCTFMDSARTSLDSARANVAMLGEQAHALVLRADATRPPTAEAGGAAGLVFLDPPYGKGLAPLALAALDRAGWLAPDAVAVVELGGDDPFAPPPGFTLQDERRYGDTRVVMLTRNNHSS